MKELKFTPNTQLHDIKHKIRRVPEFFAEGEKVRVSVRFAGREVIHPETGIALINKVVSLIEDVQVDKQPSLDGKVMSAILSRKTTKGLAPAKDKEKTQ